MLRGNVIIWVRFAVASIINEASLSTLTAVAYCRVASSSRFFRYRRCSHQLCVITCCQQLASQPHNAPVVFGPCPRLLFFATSSFCSRPPFFFVNVISNCTSDSRTISAADRSCRRVGSRLIGTIPRCSIHRNCPRAELCREQLRELLTGMETNDFSNCIPIGADGITGLGEVLRERVCL